MTGRFELDRFAPAAAAIAALLQPYAEVVLHDLASGRVAAIWNATSGRRSGDESLIESLAGNAVPSVLGPYTKTGINGATLRSVSAILPGSAPGEPPVGLLCVNLDVSQLEAAQRLLASFVAPLARRPDVLFAGDWREAVNDAVHRWSTERGLVPSDLTRAERVELIASLDGRGLFEAKHSIQHVGKMLGVSRASVYAYLADTRTWARKDAA